MSKLSSDIMLGAGLVKLTPNTWLEDDCGCLIGMGLKASGIEYAMLGEVEAVYPWLRQEFRIPEIIKTQPVFNYYCMIYESNGDVMPAIGIISAMAYAVKSGHMTLEQAVDWIRQNEPVDCEAASPETVHEPRLEPVEVK